MQAEWMAAMRRGDYEAAWAISDQVLAGQDQCCRDDPRLPYHLRWVWAGEPLANNDVLVRCYHGLGDTLQFARYLPAVKSVAKSLTVEAQPELCPLISGMGVADRVVPFRTEAPLPPAACNVEIMELPHALRLPPDAALRPPYLRIEQSCGRGGIGVCWRGGNWDPERSLPETAVSAFLSVMHDPPVCLQPHPTSLKVSNREGCSADMQNTAALIDSLDLVITVDSMVAHLAGALNRRTWVLLKHDADWRWMADRIDSPWYSNHRLYRQSSSGDWSNVVADVVRDLETFTAAG